MSDSLRQYRAIRAALLQLYPTILTATRRMSRMIMERTVEISANWERMRLTTGIP